MDDTTVWRSTEQEGDFTVKTERLVLHFPMETLHRFYDAKRMDGDAFCKKYGYTAGMVDNYDPNEGRKGRTDEYPKAFVQIRPERFEFAESELLYPHLAIVWQHNAYNVRALRIDEIDDDKKRIVKATAKYLDFDTNTYHRFVVYLLSEDERLEADGTITAVKEGTDAYEATMANLLTALQCAKKELDNIHNDGAFLMKNCPQDMKSKISGDMYFTAKDLGYELKTIISRLTAAENDLHSLRTLYETWKGQEKR